MLVVAAVATDIAPSLTSESGGKVGVGKMNAGGDLAEGLLPIVAIGVPVEFLPGVILVAEGGDDVLELVF